MSSANAKKPTNPIATPATKSNLDAVITDSTQFHANPLDSIPIDVSLPFPIYVRVSDYFVLFRNEGDRITPERERLLRQKKLDTVYIPTHSWDKFLSSLEESLDLDDPLKKEENAAQLRNVVVAYEKEWEAKCQILSHHYNKFQIWGAWLAETMRENPAVGLGLLRHFDNPALYYVNHSFNVAVYSAFMAFKIKMPLNQVQELVIAALLHNAGNIALPKEVLYKIEPLESVEWQILQSHTLKGAAMLKSIGATDAVIAAAEQHHERMDGRGYPKGLMGDEIHLYAKIISVADVYDALLSPRPHHPAPYYPKLAMEMMANMKGKFDPNLFDFIAKLKAQK